MSDTGIKKLRDKVLVVLKDKPETRDDDQLLTIHIWWRFHPHLIKKIDIDGKPRAAVLLKDTLILPKQDNIRRVRAKIQNEEGKFLPTSEKVAKQRKINEDVWRTYCLNN